MQADLPALSTQPETQTSAWPAGQAALPKVSVVIVSYNSLSDLQRCLPSIVTLNYPDFEVIVVDNASTDQGPSYVEQAFPQVRLIQNGQNLGYTGGNNAGFEAAAGDYIAVLNPDTRMEPDWLYQLVSALEAAPQAGMAAGKMLFMHPPHRINSCGLDITFTGLSFLRGLDEPAGRYPLPEVIFGVAGSAFIIKRAVLDRLGGFADLMFTYYEDTDLSLRANLAGYTCLYVPAALGYHDYKFKFSAFKCFLQERNRFYSLLTTLKIPTLLLLLPTLLLSEIIAWGYALLQGPEHLKAKLQSHLWLVKNWNQVREARRQVQHLRRVPDRALLRRFSWRMVLFNTTRPWVAKLLSITLNPLVWAWGAVCRTIVFW